MAGTVIVPWYATGFRADGFAEASGQTADGIRSMIAGSTPTPI